MTPGQAVFDAFVTETQARVEWWPPTPWDELPKEFRERWERIAAAGIEVGPFTPQRLAAGNQKLRAERDQLRELLREVLAEIELGTLSQHTHVATTRTLRRTAEWREAAGLKAS